jgi:ATP-dependent DNA ligase
MFTTMPTRQCPLTVEEQRPSVYIDHSVLPGTFATNAPRLPTNILVAQIEYAEWTDGNHLRHSKFVALRDDQDVGVVRGELPTTK